MNTEEPSHPRRAGTANPPTTIVDFIGFHANIILILRSGILTSMRDFPKSLSQAMLVGVMLAGGLGVAGVSKPVIRYPLPSTRLFVDK